MVLNWYEPIGVCSNSTTLYLTNTSSETIYINFLGSVDDDIVFNGVIWNDGMYPYYAGGCRGTNGNHGVNCTQILAPAATLSIYGIDNGGGGFIAGPSVLGSPMTISITSPTYPSGSFDASCCPSPYCFISKNNFFNGWDLPAPWNYKATPNGLQGHGINSGEFYRDITISRNEARLKGVDLTVGTQIDIGTFNGWYNKSSLSYMTSPWRATVYYQYGAYVLLGGSTMSGVSSNGCLKSDYLNAVLSKPTLNNYYPNGGFII